MGIAWRNTVNSWGGVAKSIHWIIAVLIFAQLASGKVAEAMKLSPQKIDLFVWHKSVGVTILLLVVIRLAWRFASPPPVLNGNRPIWENRLAALGHFLLYVLMFAVPLSGWWISDASRVPFKAYFVLPTPDFIETNRSLQETATVVHEILTTVLLVVVVVHIAAGLRHHFWIGDDTLRRMLPGSGRSKS